ncbi:uncharacterized protein J4E92_001308 [Alternaria infectoria]|uniref:uncharacterized protein n=1 Tax=Alternaria infectoria TaxID=45303 RepID=UPI0022210100|nr:uncharacterized protein J4E92_001308 [Alternaria infectoria]KAI4940020.1 hypothetical protein J4E92_001308 [Alternaria infectoria]
MAQHPIATLNEELIPRLPPSSPTLFEAKKKKNLSFEAIAKHVGRDEVAIAALFYGQAMASAEDIKKLSEILEIDAGLLESQLGGFPNRGSTLDMPPKDPTIYRLYEIVQNYGQAYKAVMHEKFGDGIMSAISFSTKVEKETDDKGEWAKITLRGKCHARTSKNHPHELTRVDHDHEAKMPATLEPIRRVKCTYKDCNMSFETEKIMKNHKKNTDEHEYCHKCDEDFDTFEDYAMHKITRPEEHNLACRVCGDEFKSKSGLKRHIELNHKVNQKLTCIGCQKSFYRACLFIEHLEFGHCDVISAAQFQGHIVHKHLITDLLKDGQQLTRFLQKTSKYEAAIDDDVRRTGVSLDDDPLDDEHEIGDVQYEAIKPEKSEDEDPPVFYGRYPPLPSQAKSIPDVDAAIAPMMGGISLNGDAGNDSDCSTAVGSPVVTGYPARTGSLPGHSHQGQSCSSIHEGSAVQSSNTQSSSRQTKVWGSRKGKTTSSVLFPNAKPKAPPSDFSISAHDETMEKEHGPNLLSDRFWDPMSDDWNPDRFYDPIVSKYFCPFICEQSFPIPSDLNTHILGDHRITRMKCPKCLKYFKHATALMAHCESRGARCNINQTDNFAIFLDRMSGGFLGVEEKIRPDHLNTRSVMIQNSETGHMELYKPPVASYLQYEVTTPPDWKNPVRQGVTIGGMGGGSRW